MRCILLLYLLLDAPFAYAELNGWIRELGSNTPVPGVLITNTSSGRVVLSSSHGGFSIEARPGDTLTFRHVSYRHRYVVVANTAHDLDVKLEIASETLNMVTIRPETSPYQNDSLKWRSLYGKKLDERPAKFGYQKRHPLYGGAGSGSLNFNAPISAFVQRRTKKYKRLKAFQDQFNRDEARRFIDSRYSPELVGDLTRLPADSIDLFIRTYPLAYDFARSASDLELMMWIKYNYRQWMGLQSALVDSPD